MLLIRMRINHGNVFYLPTKRKITQEMRTFETSIRGMILPSPPRIANIASAPSSVRSSCTQIPETVMPCARSVADRGAAGAAGLWL